MNMSSGQQQGRHPGGNQGGNKEATKRQQCGTEDTSSSKRQRVFTEELRQEFMQKQQRPICPWWGTQQGCTKGKKCQDFGLEMMEALLVVKRG